MLNTLYTPRRLSDHFRTVSWLVASERVHCTIHSSFTQQGHCEQTRTEPRHSHDVGLVDAAAVRQRLVGGEALDGARQERAPQTLLGRHLQVPVHKQPRYSTYMYSYYWCDDDVYKLKYIIHTSSTK